MRSLWHLLLAGLAALLLGLPGVGSPGGGGDPGVWILPCSRPMTGVTFPDSILQAPRSSYDVNAVTNGISLLLPSGMGTPLVTLYEMPSCTPVPVTVSGRYLIISKEVLIALNSGTGIVQGVIVDSSSNGFALSSYRFESGGLHFMVY
jgi:hypothetical protein